MIPDDVRRAVDERDGGTSPTGVRCRWCGATNKGRDVHHIEYRRGSSYDVLENLVSLCRTHHGFAHGTPLPGGQRIVKDVAQRVLFAVIEQPGNTGAAIWRQMKARFAQDGLCEHGDQPAECRWCPSS